MSVINTNIAAKMAQAALRANERPLTVEMEKLSTGKRINSSRDDAAGMAIASWMTAEIKSLDQAIRNANDGVSLLQTADASTGEITAMLQRMRELSVLSATDTYNTAQRTFMDMEFQQLKKQIVQIADKTEWNGFPILNGSTGLPVGLETKTTGLGSFSATPAITLPTFSNSDLVINGVPIGKPLADSDKVSPFTSGGTDYRSYSAIARAAAINAKVQDTGGVKAIAQATLLAGATMTAAAGSVNTTGKITINGTAIDVSVIPGDTVNSRTQITRAINTMTPTTGISAKDTGQDATGIQLIGADGRNIEVSMDAGLVGITGIKTGLQTGNILLTTATRDDSLTLSSPNGSISNWGLSAGTIDSSLTRTSTATRASTSGTTLGTVLPLNAGDLSINGVNIRATTAADDSVSFTTANSSDKARSAIALAAAINAFSAQTDVTAVAVGPLLQGVAMGTANGTSTLLLNGRTVSISLDSTDTTAQRLAKVVAAINAGTATDGGLAGHGANASLGSTGGVDLTTVDGRNLSTCIALGGSMTNADLGLSASIPSGVTSTTFYGTVTLQSEKPFEVKPGTNGYSTSSNFTALGFLEGNYGGQSAGQLTFQVGARANQTISIKMPDFGNKGDITGLVTADVDEVSPIVQIATAETSNTAIDLLDRVLRNVNEARGTIGSVVNRLNHAMDNLTNVSMNTSASRSKVEDTDYASASSDLARAQIIQQAATAVLAQANTSQQQVLKLLQG
jgi:flagellin